MAAARTCAGMRRLAVGSMALFLAFQCPGEVEVQWPTSLSPERRTLLTKALAYVEAHPGVPYRTGGSDAAGMDCSGAIVRFLGLVDIHPPRSSQGQYEWLRREGRLIPVGAGAKSVVDPVFRALQPGDLVFWGRMNPPTKGTVRNGTNLSPVGSAVSADGGPFPDWPTRPTGSPDPAGLQAASESRLKVVPFRTVRVTHVHMFLGHEPDGRAVMIGSSDGRSYRGRRVRGLGIVDFTVPTLGRSTRILGFGSPLPKPRARELRRPPSGAGNPAAGLDTPPGVP